ncbi:DUF2785 domain-containing protein [Alicyclobacillus fructus]|uniref:DUF2785 domain-containing protein n=1 Tax=Alicyclobacillus fructus TaxID=2816082 RepID=UPI001A8D7456|nr:DUF2785 domain-containing protein [Alicyclobacillus fructus]
MRKAYDECPIELLNRLLAGLHAPDGEVRDEIAYSLFCRLLEMGAIPPEQLAWLLEQLLSDDHLFHGIGRVGDDSVFGRSFSALVAGHILDVDARRRVLERDLVLHAIARIARYASCERDRRGYVPGKGWAHSAAHTADALAACAQHPVAGEAEWASILAAIADVVDHAEPLIYLEDERLAIAVRSVFRRAGWRRELWNRWLAQFRLPSEWTPEATIRHANRAHLLHWVRLYLSSEDGAGALIREIDELLMDLRMDKG